ncbi:MAG: hypothetical protein GY854_10655, partial [Deltaproteobacteria bacterium]|nr:hypothetical protein [Deltaproteobacteria bacterium]
KSVENGERRFRVCARQERVYIHHCSPQPIWRYLDGVEKKGEVIVQCHGNDLALSVSGNSLLFEYRGKNETVKAAVTIPQPVPADPAMPNPAYPDTMLLMKASDDIIIIDDQNPWNYPLKGGGGYASYIAKGKWGEEAYAHFDWCVVNAEKARERYTKHDNELNDSPLLKTALELTRKSNCKIDNCARMVPYSEIGDVLSQELCGLSPRGNAKTVWNTSCRGTVLEESGVDTGIWPDFYDLDKYPENDIWHRYFINGEFDGNQSDLDNNGIGDKCDFPPDVRRFKQHHSAKYEKVFSGQPFWMPSRWGKPWEVVSCAPPYNDHKLCDSVTGYPVTMGPNSDEDYDGHDRCECPPSTEYDNGVCELTKYIQKPEMQLNFMILGSMMECPDPDCTNTQSGSKCADCYYELTPPENSVMQDATIGACVCAVGEEVPCNGALQSCDQRVLAQYLDPDNMRYPYHEHIHHFGADTDAQHRNQSLPVSPQCAANTSLITGLPGGLSVPGAAFLYSAWDNYALKQGNGCEKMLFNFAVLANANPWRVMSWNYFNEPAKDNDGSFPFVGTESTPRYVAQWMGWMLEEPSEPGDRPVWHKHRYTGEDDANVFHFPSGIQPDEEIGGFTRYKTPSEAGIVWYENNCKHIIETPFPETRTKPPVIQMREVWNLGNADDVINRLPPGQLFKSFEIINEIATRPGLTPELVTNHFDPIRGLIGLAQNRPAIGLDESRVTVGLRFAGGMAQPVFQEQLAALVSQTANLFDGPALFTTMYGGVMDNGAYSNSLWIEMDWIDQNHWYRLPLTGAPPALVKTSMVHDNASSRLFLLGGERESGAWLDGIWVFDLTTGSTMSLLRAGYSALPAGFRDYSVAHDTKGRKAYLIGGTRNGNPVSDIYQVDLSTGAVSEIIVTNSSPPPRIGAAVAYSFVHQSIILAGGRQGDTLLGDIWKLNTRTKKWTCMDPGTDAPSRVARVNATVLPSPISSTIYLAGGTSNTGREDLQQMFSFDPAKGWQFLDTRPAVSLETGGRIDGTWRDGDNVLLPLNLPGPHNPAGDTVLVNLEIEAGKSLDVELWDLEGDLLSSFMNATDALAVPVFARRGQKLALRLRGSEGMMSVDYAVFTEPAEVLKADDKGFHSLGGFDVQEDIGVVANGSTIRVSGVHADGTMEGLGTVSALLAADVVIDGDYAYVADAYRGLVVVDISDPAAPREVASEHTLGYTRRIAKFGDTVYLSAGLFGIQVMDVSVPTQPKWVDNMMLCDYVEDVSVGGGMLVAATLFDGLSFISLAGGDMTEVATFEPESWVVDTAISGGIVHALLHHGDVQQVDVSSPHKARSMGVYPDAERAVTAKLGNGFIMMPDYGGWCSDDLETYTFVSAADKEPCGATFCVPGETCCDDSYCVDLQSDVNNCGACGRWCWAWEQCSGGSCSWW